MKIEAGDKVYCYKDLIGAADGLRHFIKGKWYFVKYFSCHYQNWEGDDMVYCVLGSEITDTSHIPCEDMDSHFLTFKEMRKKKLEKLESNV